MYPRIVNILQSRSFFLFGARGTLNEVHHIIEHEDYHEKIKFALTGSSARRLKRGGADRSENRSLFAFSRSRSLIQRRNC